jgi:HEAT repeat protein
MEEDIYQCLRSFGAKGVSPILEIVQTQDPFPLSTAQKIPLIEILGNYPQAKVSAYLATCLVALDRPLQAAATEALRKQGKVAEKILLKVIDDLPPDHRALKTCIYLLGSMRSHRAVPQLFRLFCQEKNPALLCLQAWALGHSQVGEAVHPLLFALEEENSWMVKRSILRALGELRSPLAVESVISFLADRDLREAAIEALGKIGGEFAVEALRPFLANPVRYLRVLTVRALGRIGGPEALKLLVEGLRDPDALVSRKASEELGEFYDEQEMEEIQERLAQREARKNRFAAWSNLTGVQTPPPEQATSSLDSEFQREREEPMDPWRSKKGNLSERLRGYAEGKLNRLAERLTEQAERHAAYGAYYDPATKKRPLSW